ncbi:MAG: type 1 periplasmic-binding domain-containing protein, partial [Mycobacteriales bacterium]
SGLGGLAGGSSTASGGGSTGGLGTLGSGSAGSISGSGGGSSGSVGTATGGGSAGSAALVGGIPATGRGWDKKYVYIGVTTEKDTEQVYAQAGYSGIDPGDTQAQALAFAADINRHGGMFGRQVQLAFKDVPTLSTAENPAPEAQAVCTYFTQDRPVIAVVNMVTIMDGMPFRSCLAQAKVPLFSASDAAMDNQASQPLAPYLYTLIVPSWNLLAPALVSRLKAEGWFGGWNPVTNSPASTPARVGILVDTSPVGTQVASIIRGALAQAGYPNALVYQYNQPGDEIQPAILYFNGHGVTHIISDDIELTAFQISAESQHYYPRYGVSTYNDPYSNLQNVSPAAENTGDLGVGWAPTFDVSDQNDPGVTGPGERECLADMANAGVHNSDRLAEAFGLAICDGIRLAAQGAVAGGGLTGMDIYQGLMRIAPSFSSAFNFANGLGPSQLFVPGAIRDLAYFSSCSCFRYTSSNYPLS